MSPRPIALRRVRPLQAHMLGLRQPVVLAYLALDAVPDDLPARLHTALAPYVPATHLPALEVLQGVLPVLAALVAGLQEAGGLPVLESARRLSPDGAAEHVLALPALSPQAATAALQWLVSLASALAQTPAQTGLLPAQEASLQALLRQLSKLAPAGQNNRHFIRAAHRMGLPCRELPGGVWLYGWGRRARLLRSSITGTTSAIGVGWAKDKLASSALLRLAGLPVPGRFWHQRHRSAVSVSGCWMAWWALSWPVATASGMPCMLPEGVVNGEWMSAWASIQTTPMRLSGWARRSPAIVPAAVEWSPASTSGNRPRSRVAATSSAA